MQDQAVSYVSSKDVINFVVIYPAGVISAGASSVIIAWEAYYR